MSNYSRPMYSLSVEEYKELQEEVISKLVVKLKDLLEGSSQTNQMKRDILNVEDVLELTGYRRSTLYSKVSKNEIPVVSRNRPLLFSRKAVLEWMDLGKPTVIETEATNLINRRLK